MANFVKISDVVKNATEGTETNLALVVLVTDAINDQGSSGVQEAIKGLREQLQSPVNMVRKLSLSLLDTLISECELEFRLHAFSKLVPIVEKIALQKSLRSRFSVWGFSNPAEAPVQAVSMEELAKYAIKLIQQWTLAHEETDETRTLHTCYQNLVSQNVQFPVTPHRKRVQQSADASTVITRTIPMRDPVTKDRGFLPYPDPVKTLPALFEIWEQAAFLLPKLLAAGQLQSLFDNMPVLETDARALLDEGDCERAMLLLSTFAHAYVWSSLDEAEPVTSLPPAIAVPWVVVSHKLGRPPLLSYTSHTLRNWALIDPDEPIAVGNIHTLQNLTGGIDEEWLHCMHIDMEAKAAPGVHAILKLQRMVAVTSITSEAVLSELGVITAAIEAMTATVQLLPVRLDKYIYRRRLLPYLAPVPAHIKFEGVAGYTMPSLPNMNNGLFAYLSSPSIWCLEIGLGTAPATHEVRAYINMLSLPHREFMQRLIGAEDPLARFFMQFTHGALRNAYDECVAALDTLRDLYVGLMTTDDEDGAAAVPPPAADAYPLGHVSASSSLPAVVEDSAELQAIAVEPTAARTGTRPSCDDDDGGDAGRHHHHHADAHGAALMDPPPLHKWGGGSGGGGEDDHDFAAEYGVPSSSSGANVL